MNQRHPASNSDTISDERDFWNKASFGWKKWNKFIMDWHAPIGAKVIELIDIHPSDSVLDIGTGLGEPGQTAAAIARDGNVVGIDISREMVEGANETAKRKGTSNYSAKLYDGVKFPFDGNMFDAAISRNGVIFYPEMKAAMKEVRRVLKPGGRAAFSGWGPPENNDSSVVLRKILTDVLNQELVAVDSPGPFRFARKGTFKAMLIENGFNDVREIDVTGTVKFDSNEHYWNYVSETQIPIVEALEKSPDLTPKIKSALSEFSKPFLINDELIFKWHAVIGFGVNN